MTCTRVLLSRAVQSHTRLLFSYLTADPHVRKRLVWSMPGRRAAFPRARFRAPIFYCPIQPARGLACILGVCYRLLAAGCRILVPLLIPRLKMALWSIDNILEVSPSAETGKRKLSPLPGETPKRACVRCPFYAGFTPVLESSPAGLENSRAGLETVSRSCLQRKQLYYGQSPQQPPINSYSPAPWDPHSQQKQRESSPCHPMN